MQASVGVAKAQGCARALRSRAAVGNALRLGLHLFLFVYQVARWTIHLPSRATLLRYRLPGVCRSSAPALPLWLSRIRIVIGPIGIASHRQHLIKADATAFAGTQVASHRQRQRVHVL